MGGFSLNAVLSRLHEIWVDKENQMAFLNKLFGKKQQTTSSSNQPSDTLKIIISKSSTEAEIKLALEALVENGAPAMITLIEKLRKQRDTLPRQRVKEKNISYYPYTDILNTIKNIYIELGKRGDIRALEMLTWFINYQQESELDELSMNIGELSELIGTMGYIKTPQTVIVLKNLLDYSEKSSWKYEAIISALGNIEDYGATEILIGLMNHERSYVREFAAGKLLRINSSQLSEGISFYCCGTLNHGQKLKKWEKLL